MGSLDPKTLAEGLVSIGEEAIAKPNDAALDGYFAENFVFHATTMRAVSPRSGRSSTTSDSSSN
jgi:hypothetical protein